MSNHDPRQAPSLLVDAMRSFSKLMRTELHLAKAEVSQNISRAGVGIAFIAVAALLAIIALNVLVGALVAYLAATSLSAGTAALLVGGAILVVAVILVLVGKSRLTGSALEPTRTMHNLQRDAATVKGATNA